MGRKRGAPQPLALAESHSQGSEGSNSSPHGIGIGIGIGTGTDTGDMNVSSHDLSSAVTDFTALGGQALASLQSQSSPVQALPVVGVASSGSGEDTLLAVSTPTSSKSSRSPRSPFSRFNTSKKAQVPPQSQSSYQSQLAETPPQHSPSQTDNIQQEYYNNQNHQHPDPESHSDHSPHFTASSDTNTIHKSSTTPILRNGAGQYRRPTTAHQPPPHRENEKHSRSASRFFNFNKPSRSTQGLHQPPSSNRSQTDVSYEAMSRGTDYPAMSDRVSSKTSKHSDQSSADYSHQKTGSLPSRSDLSLVSGNGELDLSNSSRKHKPKPFTLLSRTKSLKDREGPSPKGTSPKEPKPAKMQEPDRALTFAGQQPLTTAPLQSEGPDRSFRHVVNSSARNHSADRALPRDTTNKEIRQDKDVHNYNRSHPSSFRDTAGSAFLSGLKSSGTRAADMISKGLFGKGGRSGSTTEREPHVDDEHYQLKVINRPLVEQTRLTRISKKLEESRDKTEFWMPAFPWRAIDYLNYKGSDVEGLYRVPGSGPQIKKWQRRFDEEFDVDLFAQEDLYDINIIGSMLKAWLRELPDELFPKEAQERISRECSGAEEVPQLLVEELSNLSPYNYYLLFAITCHLSLLLAHSDKNKMDFRNLCICFQPCMKIDAFCFRFLVCDWRRCWQGCKNEAKFIEEEYMLMNQPPPRALSGGGNRGRSASNSNGANGTNETQDERNISSSDSSRQSALAREQNQQQNGKLRKKPIPPAQSNGSMESNNSTISTNLTVDSDRELPRRSGDLRPLSPIKPLSPLGF